MLNETWQPHITHKNLGNGYRLCFFAPDRSSIINGRGERQCSFFGFDSYPEALQWYQQTRQLGYRAALRRAKRVYTQYEVKVWGLDTEAFMLLSRQLKKRKQQENS